MSTVAWRELAMRAPRIDFSLQVMQYMGEQKAIGRNLDYADAYVEYAEAHPILLRLCMEQRREDVQ